LKKKKIIVNYWQIITEGNIYQEEVQLWDFLFSQEFKIYFYSKNLELVELKSTVNLLENIENIMLLTNANLTDALLAQGEDITQYDLVDHIRLKTLLDGLELFPN